MKLFLNTPQFGVVEVKKIETREDELEVIEHIEGGNLYYLLWGGLGNQLFGLSNIHLLCNRYQKKAIVDIANCEHTQAGSIPDSLLFQRYTDWVQFIDSGNIYLSNLKKNLRQITISDTNPAGGYFGWEPSVEMVRESNLYKKGSLSNATRPAASHTVGVHVRAGDYQNYSYLGILTINYYRKAVDYLRQITNSPQFIFFSDSPERAIQVATSVGCDPDLRISGSGLKALHEMANVDFLICANSTLSFWAAYLGGAPAIYPYPWFISSPHWGRDLVQSQDKILGQVRFPSLMIANYRLRSQITKVYEKISSVFP
jgi:hypothetical protein